jgi:ribosomal subunit interface protein
MQLTVKGKQLDVGEALRAHVADRLAAVLDKYFGDAIEATVILSRDAHLYRAHVSAHIARGIHAEGVAEADAPYPAFDAAADHLAKRLRRHKRWLRDHHHRQPVETEPAQQYVLAAPAEEAAGTTPDGAPTVIAEMTAEVPMLSVSEAVLRLDLADSPALLFRNRGHGELNMVYRRSDGNVGWVDPLGNRPR